MNQVIREQYRADLARQVTEEGKDLVRRSLYHFVNAGQAVDSNKTSCRLESFASMVLNDR